MQTDTNPPRRTLRPTVLAATALWSRLVLLGALVVGSGSYALELVHIQRGSFREQRAQVSDQLRRPQRFLRFDAEGVDTVAINLGARPAALFVYSRQCAACGENMPRWLDMVAELIRDGTPADIYAIGVDEDSTGAEFWRFLPQVHVLRPMEPKTFIATLGLTATPTTVVLDGSGMQVAIIGFMGPHRRARLRSALRAG